MASSIKPDKAKSLNGDELPDNCENILHVFAQDDAVGVENDMIFSCSDEYGNFVFLLM